MTLRAAADSAVLSLVSAQRPGVAPAWIFGSSVNGLSFVRSLGRRGIPTATLDSASGPAKRSQYTVFTHLPPVTREPALWLDVICAAAGRCDIPPVALITSDAPGSFFCEHEEVLRPLVRFLLPAREDFESIVDKRKQYGIAQRAGVPIPETHFPECEAEIRALAPTLAYPCILKPYRSHIGKEKIKGGKVVIVESAAALNETLLRLMDSGAPFMVQEIIPGGDDAFYGYLAFWDDESREVAWLTKQKLRQNPPHFGNGSFQQTVRMPAVASLSRTLLTALRYRGFAGVEFKLDPRTGDFKLIEVNPRTVSGNQMAISAGIDFPYIGYRHLVGAPLSPAEIGDFIPGLKYVHEEWDLKSFLTLRKTGRLTLGQWLASIRDVRAHALWASDDPGPALKVARKAARALVRRILR